MRFAVYRIRSCDGFANLVFDDRISMNRLVYFDGKIKGLNWNPPSIYVPYPDKLPWDIFNIYGTSALVLTKNGLQSLSGYFSQGQYELLPLIHQGIEYTVVNILEVINCLKEEKLRRRSDNSIEEYAFAPERFTRSLFKIPEEVTGGTFVATDASRPEWSFKYHVERHNLQGIKFKLIWEGD